MEHVQLSEAAGVARIVLNDPPTLNAMGASMAREFRDAVRRVADQPDTVRCLLITGSGRAFCSGGNLGLMAGEGQGDDAQERISLGTHHHYTLQLLRALHCPVLTAVNGPAAGFGFSLALAGDLVVAARSAYFLAAFSRLGVTPDGGLTWMLPRIVGWARARELLLLGERLPAQQASEWGLVNRVFDDETFADDVAALATRLAQGPTLALGTVRHLAWEAWDLGFSGQLDEEERRQLDVFASEDAREGVRARMEKREPRFRGR